METSPRRHLRWCITGYARRLAFSVGDLVGTGDPVSVGVVHDAGVEASDGLGHDPLEVVDHGVGVGVGGDVPADVTDENDELMNSCGLILLLVVGGPEGNHVLPQGSVPLEGAQPGRMSKRASKYIYIILQTF